MAMSAREESAFEKIITITPPLSYESTSKRSIHTKFNDQSSDESEAPMMIVCCIGSCCEADCCSWCVFFLIRSGFDMLAACRVRLTHVCLGQQFVNILLGKFSQFITAINLFTGNLDQKQNNIAFIRVRIGRKPRRIKKQRLIVMNG